MENMERLVYHFSQGRDDFAQSGEALVDVGPYFEASAFGAGGVGPLRAGQIDQRDLAGLLRRQARRRVVAALREDEREDGVRAARRFVHVRRRHRPAFAVR